MTLGELKKYAKEHGVPDTAEIFYHAYYKGCSLGPYLLEDAWVYEKGGKVEGIVINPQDDYDGRVSKLNAKKREDEYNKNINKN